MLLLYCLAVLTLLFLYYFYIPTTNTSNTLYNKCNGLFRVDSKFKNQNKFVSINDNINKNKELRKRISWKCKLWKKIIFLQDLIRPLMKYLGVSVDEETSRYRILNNGNELHFDCTQFSYRILVNYKTFNELLVDLNQNGFSHDSVKAMNVFIGVDFTASNEWKGRKTFYSQSLHKISKMNNPNPYQKAIAHLAIVINKLIVESLGLDMNGFLKINGYGFGDTFARGTSVFSIFENASMSENHGNILNTILSSYTNVAKKVDLSGPSSFAPVIRKTIETINKNKHSDAELSILVIFSDGELTHESTYETMQAIIDASSLALSIVIIGVGDGPWIHIKQLESYLCNKSKFDNLNFVDYNQFMLLNKAVGSKCLDSEFGLKLFTKLPTQFRILKQLNYI